MTIPPPLPPFSPTLSISLLSNMVMTPLPPPFSEAPTVRKFCHNFPPFPPKSAPLGASSPPLFGPVFNIFQRCAHPSSPPPLPFPPLCREGSPQEGNDRITDIYAVPSFSGFGCVRLLSNFFSPSSLLPLAFDGGPLTMGGFLPGPSPHGASTIHSFLFLFSLLFLRRWADIAFYTTDSFRKLKEISVFSLPFSEETYC